VVSFRFTIVPKGLINNKTAPNYWRFLLETLFFGFFFVVIAISDNSPGISVFRGISVIGWGCGFVHFFVCHCIYLLSQRFLTLGLNCL
jgi:hypothetical protein